MIILCVSESWIISVTRMLRQIATVDHCHYCFVKLKKNIIADVTTQSPGVNTSAVQNCNEIRLIKKRVKYSIRDENDDVKR